ncbi:MAG TPA: hypothetical protein VEZ55_01835 [Chitinophagaceae bacterium]|jgi:hypothetical protein|nr:hypothetical protein [Chitinophagaceae bacterium]
MNTAFSDLQFIGIVVSLIFTLAILHYISKLQMSISQRITAGKAKTRKRRLQKNLTAQAPTINVIRVKKEALKELA